MGISAELLAGDSLLIAEKFAENGFSKKQAAVLALSIQRALVAKGLNTSYDEKLVAQELKKAGFPTVEARGISKAFYQLFAR